MLYDNSKTILLIVNPAAGKLKAKTGLFEITAPFCAANRAVTLYLTSQRGEARDVARTMGGKFDTVVCCGGDGTLNEVIDGLITGGHTTPLGYIPAGSTNDFAATLGLSTNLSTAAKTILSGTTKKIDIGMFNKSRHFSYIASFGAFSAASYNAPQASKNELGHLAYIIEGIKDLPSLKPVELTAVTDDGRKFSGSYIFGALSNSTSIGGMVKLSPSDVDLSDGYLELLLVRMPKTIQSLNHIFVALTTRAYHSAPEIELTRVRGIHFEMNDSTPWSLDGEYEKGGQSVDISALPGAANLLL